MPIYEYSCENCGKVTEKLVSFSAADNPVECPECKGEAKRMISASAFHLKGGGWYAQGYGKNESKPSCPAAGSGGGCGGCPAAKG
ncbi:FmdB family zinc ribbon protein [Seleniivibrio woodruffii]|uniref:Putative FmdB family regulatory protein n=1 Tax=Seleniivibrio woodruffii TaxID=1078050 RepID=A0A4R1KCU8_9BACT|nr:zinc ribbon domain-containing protein [Seleniivibrio woodruffii]TCK62376.1 putative FmdB family regulatory protein [Seleniivibrio woodruffii]TVZ34506.1 putative FmdB family regulatory protein [Seleniivibrio woodruffii]